MSSSFVSWHVNKVTCIQCDSGVHSDLYNWTLLRRSHYLIPCDHNFSCSQPHTYCTMLFLFYFCTELITYRFKLILSTLNSAVMHNLKYSPCKNTMNSSLENNVLYTYCNYINNLHTGRSHCTLALCLWKSSKNQTQNSHLKQCISSGLGE